VFLSCRGASIADWLFFTIFRVRIPGQGIHDAHGFHAHPDNLTDQTDDVFGIVFAVRVGADTAPRVLGDAVLIDDPFEDRAIAEPVLEGFGRDACEREGVVDAERGSNPHDYLERRGSFDTLSRRMLFRGVRLTFAGTQWYPPL
jgi:hypothetical protein